MTLAIDTCTHEGTLCLASRYEILGERSWSLPGSHSEVITLELEKLLEDSRVSLRQIGQIVVGNGPGSFTGIRIGLNLAKSLGYSLKAPIFEYSTLLGFAEFAATSVHSSVLSVIPGFRDLYYCAIYKFEDRGGWTEVLQPSAMTALQIEAEVDRGQLTVGLGAQDLSRELPGLELNIVPDSSKPSARNLILLQQRQPDFKLNTKDWKQSSPLYVRASEAEEKRKL